MEFLFLDQVLAQLRAALECDDLSCAVASVVSPGPAAETADYLAVTDGREQFCGAINLYWRIVAGYENSSRYYSDGVTVKGQM